MSHGITYVAPSTFSALALSLLVSMMFFVDCLHAAQVQAYELSLPGKSQVTSAKGETSAESLLSKMLLAGSSQSPEANDDKLDDDIKISSEDVDNDNETELKRLNQANRQYALKKKLHKIVDDLIDGEEQVAKKNKKALFSSSSNKIPKSLKFTGEPVEGKRIKKRAPAPLALADQESAGEKIFILVKKPPMEQDADSTDLSDRSRRFTNEHMRDLANDKFGIREAVRKMKTMGLVYGNIRENQIGQSDEVF